MTRKKEKMCPIKLFFTVFMFMVDRRGGMDYSLLCIAAACLCVTILILSYLAVY